MYAARFGIDASLLGFSTQDYLLRSTDVLYRAFVLVVLTILAALWLHVAVTHGITRAPVRAVLRWMTRLTAVVGAGLVVFGAAMMFGPPTLFVGSSSLGLGTVVLAYSVHVGRRIRGIQQRMSPRTREERRLETVTRVLIGMLIVLSMFWASRDFAIALGRGAALTLIRQLDSRPATVVYSADRLQLEGPGVHEARLDPTDAAYRFRYTGLRLLVRSGHNYFLLPDGWTPDHGNTIVLPDDGTLRLEFTVSTR